MSAAGTPKCSAATSVMRVLICSAALSAAMPLRSEPGGCGGRRRVRHLAGRGRRHADIAEVDAERLRHHLRDLDEQTLAHLGAAVVEHHAAIGIDVHQRARLVERRAVERDAELDRHGGEALLHDRIVAVEGVDILAPALDVDRALEFADHALDDVVLDAHAVGRHVVAADAVVVALSYGGDRQLQVPRDDLDDGLDRHHALRAAIAAERGVRHRVGLAGEAAQAHMRQPVAVVGMAERARDAPRAYGRRRGRRSPPASGRARGCGPRRRSRPRSGSGTDGACRWRACRRRAAAAASPAAAS